MAYLLSSLISGASTLPPGHDDDDGSKQASACHVPGFVQSLLCVYFLYPPNICVHVSPTLQKRLPDTERLETCLMSHSEAEPGLESNKYNHCGLSFGRLFQLPNPQPKGVQTEMFLLDCESGDMYHLPATNLSLPAILPSSTGPCPLQPRKRRSELKSKQPPKIKLWVLSFHWLRSQRVSKRIFQS